MSTDPRLELVDVDELTARRWQRVRRVSYRLRYVTRFIGVGDRMRATAPSDRGRELEVIRFDEDGAYAHVRRSSSRRTQRISTRRLATAYAPLTASRGWARWTPHVNETRNR